MAQAFVTGASAGVPRFEPPPSAQLRLLTAASWGRLDGARHGHDDVPDRPGRRTVVAGPRTRARLVAPRRTPRGLRSPAAPRLSAARGRGDRAEPRSTPRKHVFSPELALEQLAVLRCHLPSSAVEAMALRGARSGLPPETRRDLALFVVFRNAARGADSTSMQAAAALAMKASSELPQNGFIAALHRARLHRAIAAVPFVQHDIVETHRLARPRTGIADVGRRRAPPRSIGWRGRTRPTPSTPSSCRRTSSVGLGQRAVGYADELVELSPGDDRTWALRGDTLVACGRLEAAVEAYGRGIALGGWGAARAAYRRGFVLERLGRWPRPPRTTCCPSASTRPRRWWWRRLCRWAAMTGRCRRAGWPRTGRWWTPWC